MAKTNLITREGYQQLQQEHDYLWHEKRPEITKIVTWAASLGDRSENADYQFNKRVLRQIDRRVRYLRKRMPDLKIVDYNPQQAGKVFLVLGSKLKMNKAIQSAFVLSAPTKFTSAKITFRLMHLWLERYLANR